ncbi:MAG TPA: hypothetical protein PLO53_13370 [Candidatus Hydrogenedentes bacterium]|nr:hypothetical protein [Candidatus Hydrogenedentota bacterium]
MRNILCCLAGMALIMNIPSVWAEGNNPMDSLMKIRNAETRSISPENFTGEKGKGGNGHPRRRVCPARRP